MGSLKNQTADVAECTAIMFLRRVHTKTLVREEFKSIGIVNFLMADNAAQCVTFLQQNPEAWFVVELDGNQDAVVRVLEDSAGPNHLRIRPTLLISRELTLEITGLAAEYQISRIHSGELTRAKFHLHAVEMRNDWNAMSALREGMMSAAADQMSDRCEDAMRTLGGLVKDYPSNPRLKAQIIDGLIQLDRWEEATEHAYALMDSHENYPRGLQLLGRCLMKQGKFDEACDILKKAKLLNPFNPTRLVILGRALLEIDKRSEARENFEQALKIQQGRKDATVGLAETMLLEGEVNEALKLLSEASNPRELASIFNTSAVLSMRHGRFAMGEKLYQSCFKVVGEDVYLLSRLWYNMGIGYIRWSKPQQALECFERAASTDPAFENATGNAAVVARQIKSKAQGLRDPGLLPEELSEESIAVYKSGA